MTFIHRRNLTNLKPRSFIMYSRVLRSLFKVRTSVRIVNEYFGKEYKNINKFYIHNKVLISKYKILKTLYYELIRQYPNLKHSYNKYQTLQLYTLYILKKRDYI